MLVEITYYANYLYSLLIYVCLIKFINTINKESDDNNNIVMILTNDCYSNN